MRQPATTETMTTEHNECERKGDIKRVQGRERERVGKWVAAQQSTTILYTYVQSTTYENACSVDERKRKTAAAQSQVAELVWES